MPSFEIIQQVELFLRKGKFRSSATEQAKRAVRRACKYYVYQDGWLLRKYKGRFLRAVSSLDQVNEIMRQFHDNNQHAGRTLMVPQIMSLYYWERVRDYVKEWIQKCELCRSRRSQQVQENVRACLAYGCDTSSFLHPELSFHRFPKAREQRQRWLVVAQRDEGSIRRDSFLCSRHFQPHCFFLNEEGREELRPNAVPTVIGVAKHQQESQPSEPEEPLFHPSSLEDLLTCAAASAEECAVGFSGEQSDPAHEEHQYSLRSPDPHPPDAPAGLLNSKKNTSFTTYNHIAKYLSHRILPQATKRSKSSLRRTAKRFTLIDGVLMYKLRSHPVRVPRSREEVSDSTLLSQLCRRCPGPSNADSAQWLHVTHLLLRKSQQHVSSLADSLLVWENSLCTVA